MYPACMITVHDRKSRALLVSTMQGVRIYVSKRVKRIVLRVLITVVQLDGHKEHCGDHWLILKSDAANLWQKLESHGVYWGGAMFSSGM